MSNINNNNNRKIDCRLINDYYMDFMISKDDIIYDNFNQLNGNFATRLEFKNVKDKFVVSDISWINAINSDKILDNIGYTGVDNGFIQYEKDRISNEEFLDIYTNSKFDLSTYGSNFFVTEVGGNTGDFIYPIELNEDYVSFKGGFYQGFFKIQCDKYQTLPDVIENEWNFNFNLRCKDYETPYNILNEKHPNNKGIFFYIGTRAENKFWELYGENPEMDKFKYDNIDGYMADDYMDNNANDCQYIDDNDYFIPCDSSDSEYLKKQISLENLKLIDSKGNPIDETGFYEIETDNKFIIFNRGEYGYTTKTWKDEYQMLITGKSINNNLNYFPYLNNTKEGYNKKNINELIEKFEKDYDVLGDLKNNALGFKINEDGSISYRYFSSCELVEESSKSNLVKKDEWTNIRIRIVKKNTQLYGGVMQIYIYVNGYLKFISKELPELLLKPLKVDAEKQEGVPYSISIGGGTQGLCERILKDYYDITDYQLPIEKYFAGTFIGDIKDFNFISY